MRGSETDKHNAGAHARKPSGDARPSLPIPAPWGGDIYTGRDAEEAARQHDEYLQALTSMHRGCAAVIDWEARAGVTPPPGPRPVHTNERAAQKAMNAYRPTLMSRLLGKVKAERRALRNNVAEGWVLDEKLFSAKEAAYEQGLRLHEEAVALARRVLAGEAAAFRQAISLADPLMPIGRLGERATFTALTPKSYAVKLFLRAEDVMPEQRVRLLASGRVAVQPFPGPDACRLLRDHVCSAGLRAARELFALLPLEDLIITAIEDTPEVNTGRESRRTLIRFRAPRSAIEALDFYELDSVEAMQKLWHRADFDGTGKLLALEPEFEETD